MKRIAVVANCEKPQSAMVLERLGNKAAELGLELLSGAGTGKLLKKASIVAPDALFDDVDAVMAVGGDGTMIRTVRELDGRDKPIMGFNIGALGFMTSVAEDDFDRAMTCLAADNFIVSERSVAKCVIERDGSEIDRFRALNEMVISRGSRSRVATLQLLIGDDEVTSYLCDGLIVSTPTGSTGHSLSAGGPILAPETLAFVISLICPHALSIRPMVVPDSSLISVIARESIGELLLTVDGQVNCSLEQGDCVKITRSKKNVKFIHLPGHSYYAVLRQKLRWSGSNV